MRSTLLLSLLLYASSPLAQGYKQKQFDKMLDGLLAHSVPEKAAKNLNYDSSVIYLDARAFIEFEVSRIEGAQWVGYDDFNLKRVQNLNKSQPIIVYCSIGYRSEKVTERLQQAGFTHVTNMLGGIFEWANYKKTIIDSSNKPTNKVHGFDKEWGKWLNADLIEKVY